MYKKITTKCPKAGNINTEPDRRLKERTEAITKYPTG